MKQLLIATMIATLCLGCGDGESPSNTGAGSGGGHGHAHGVGGGHSHHHGVTAALLDGAGHLELKLHDDKGDLELWLTKDEEGEKPLDLPLTAVIQVTLVHDAKPTTVELRVRNTEKNEDEDGNGNIRDGKTNYFIFPGDTGADASWLQGKAFKAKAVVAFEMDGAQVRSARFELVPHDH